MVHIDYICHSCFLITTSDTTLLFDPWTHGPCYKGQWHLYPKPVGLAKALHAEHILLTHGHEDHMHRSSLELQDKSATVWFPYQWRAGIEGYMHHIGFSKVEEAVTLRKHQLGPNTAITFLAYSLESIVIIEADGQVIVNINDAHNSNHENVVMMFLDVLKKHWPRIDLLITGFSGASYFPNQVRYPGKNDREVGQVREHYFAHNLCRYVDFLKPELVLPFAPGFRFVGGSQPLDQRGEIRSPSVAFIPRRTLRCARRYALHPLVAGRPHGGHGLSSRFALPCTTEGWWSLPFA